MFFFHDVHCVYALIEFRSIVVDVKYKDFEDERGRHRRCASVSTHQRNINTVLVFSIQGEPFMKMP